MAAQPQPAPQTRTPVLLSNIDAFQDVVTAAVVIPREDGVISVSEDRTIRVWLKRDSGQYWPSEFILAEDYNKMTPARTYTDYNKMTPARTYTAHQGRVIVVLFVLEMEWVLSTGQDKNFTWHCSESGQQLGTHRTAACVSGLQFDVETRHAFVGDQSGQVTILKLEQDSCSMVTTFKGHTGNVTALCWDPGQRVLFSGSSDNSIIIDKVQGLCYASHTRQLISCSSDGSIVIWNMDVTRQEHHCRKCGQAVCGKCSSKRSTIPLMGFEFEVRVCDSCHESITDEE
ncbi:hypothetical protein CRUP_006998 [Coryphaenoides rupestris]|nr:hypothetical protein CRUP_006998 [Coryphaenoides rupestris]